LLMGHYQPQAVLPSHRYRSIRLTEIVDLLVAVLQVTEESRMAAWM